MTGRRIAAWMIMCQHDTGAAVLGRVEDDLPQRKMGARLIALMAGDVQATGLVVDMCHEQDLTSWVGLSEAAGEEPACGREAIER